MWNFVAVPTSTTVGGACYKEGFERFWNVPEVRFPKSHCDSKISRLFQKSPFICCPSFFTQAKTCFIHFLAAAPCLIWQRGKHDPVPLVHEWCSSFSAFAPCRVLESNCLISSHFSARLYSWPGWEWAKPMEDHVSIEQNAWFPSYRQGCARNPSSSENSVRGSEVAVTFRKITSRVFISVGVNSRAEIACVVPQPKKGKRNWTFCTGWGFQLKSPACFLFAWPITSLLLLSSLWSCNEIHTQEQSLGAQEGSRKTSTYNLARLLLLCCLLDFVQHELSPSRHTQQLHQPPDLPPCWTQQPQLSISFSTTLRMSCPALTCPLGFWALLRSSSTGWQCTSAVKVLWCEM